MAAFPLSLKSLAREVARAVPWGTFTSPVQSTWALQPTAGPNLPVWWVSPLENESAWPNPAFRCLQDRTTAAYNRRKDSEWKLPTKARSSWPTEVLEEIGWAAGAAVDDTASGAGGFRATRQWLLLKRSRQLKGAEERSRCLRSCDFFKKCYIISLPQNRPTNQQFHKDKPYVFFKILSPQSSQSVTEYIFGRCVFGTPSGESWCVAPPSVKVSPLCLRLQGAQLSQGASSVPLRPSLSALRPYFPGAIPAQWLSGQGHKWEVPSVRVQDPSEGWLCEVLLRSLKTTPQSKPRPPALFPCLSHSPVVGQALGSNRHPLPLSLSGFPSQVLLPQIYLLHI